jgi:hypothetical protein
MAAGPDRSENEMIEDLVREGLITPATQPPGDPPPAPLPVMTLDELLGNLDPSRGDR